MDEKSKLMTEIMFLAMKLQNETDHVVFVNLSGHVNWIDLSIRKSKENYNDEVASCRIYLSHGNSLDRLQEVKEKLLGFIEEKEVDVSGLEYTVEEIYHHYF